MDRGASWAAVQGVAKCQTGLTDFHLLKHKRCLRDKVTSRIKEKDNWSHKTGRNQGRPGTGNHNQGQHRKSLVKAPLALDTGHHHQTRLLLRTASTVIGYCCPCHAWIINCVILVSLDIPDSGWSIRLVKAESRTSTLVTMGVGEGIFIISRYCSENEVLSLIDSHKGVFLSNKKAVWMLSRQKMPNI